MQKFNQLNVPPPELIIRPPINTTSDFISKPEPLGTPPIQYENTAKPNEHLFSANREVHKNSFGEVLLIVLAYIFFIITFPFSICTAIKVYIKIVALKFYNFINGQFFYQLFRFVMNMSEH